MSVTKAIITTCISVVFLLLSSCATVVEQSGSTVEIADGASLTLTLPPKALVGQHLSQLMIVKYGQSSQQMMVQVQFEQHQLIMVAVSVQGVPLFELAMNALGQVTLQSYISLPDLNPMYVLADIQLTHWPIENLATQLMGGSIKSSINEVTQVRELLVNDNTVIRINKRSQFTEFTHIERQYQLQLTDMEE